ncbi:LysR family transcriptional regulator [uncultured Roseobacter sp.]|uniref:LysR family transcriptional regulator n=1 Tax=uncultured Roseobacter sp. TaxID=114847 RepID=UPI0026163E43|nr:LysR family transcriptional regulator [uncultured Roseobacter sp.]
MTVSLRSMRYFNTVVAHGSIAQAAAELNIAASAVSAAVDQIEEQFQLKLLNRFRSRGITVTASGKVMERKFARLLEEYDAVLTEGSELKNALKGDLRIGYYAPVAPAFLPEILLSLTQSHFQTTIHLEECDNYRAQEGQLAGEYDAILFVSDGALPQIEYDVLIEAPAYCLVPADHPLSQKISVNLRDLAKSNLIVLNRPFAVDYYRQLFGVAENAPETIAYANSTEMVRSLVGAGHGVAVLNMLPSTDVSYAGDQLVARPITDPLPHLTLSLGYDKSNPRRIVEQFVESCKSYFLNADGHRHIVAASPTD